MRKTILFFIILFQLNLCAFAEIYNKNKEVLIPQGADIQQTVETAKMEIIMDTIKKTEGFIMSEKKITTANKIKKHEIESVAIGAVKIIDSHYSVINKNGKQYAVINVSFEIDHNSAIANFNRRSEEEKAAAVREAEAWKEKYEELKKQGDSGLPGLASEIRQLIESQASIANEFEKLALSANKEYMDFQGEQNKKSQDRLAMLEKQKNDFSKIIDQMRKNDYERNSDITILEKNTKDDVLSLLPSKTEDIQKAISQAEEIMKKIEIQKQKYKMQLQLHEREISKTYDKYISIIENLIEEKKAKGEYETKKQYMKRITETLIPLYQQKNMLEQGKQKEISENRSSHYSSYGRAITQYVEKLLQIQSGYYSQNGKRRYADISRKINITDENIEESYFMIKVNYENESYNLAYFFSDNDSLKKITQNRKKLRNNIMAMPLFSIEEQNGKIQKKLIAFDIIYPVSGIGTKRIHLHRMLRDISDNRIFFTFM